jgi:hypothetical protein
MTAPVLPVEMPQLSGGRKRAQALIEPLLGRMAGHTVVLDCRQLVAGTPSFADEIVRLVPRDGGAQLLEVTNVDSEFGGGDLLAAAKNHGVSQLLRIS